MVICIYIHLRNNIITSFQVSFLLNTTSIEGGDLVKFAPKHPLSAYTYH